MQNREEAEDVVQDAFVKAWKGRWQVRHPEKFPAWIATIVRNRAHDILIRRRTRQAECAHLLSLLRRADETGLIGNINLA